MFRVRHIIVLGTVVACLLVSCDKAAQEVMEGAVESRIAQEGGEADVDIGKKSFSMRVKGQAGDSQLNFGAGTKVPTGFPKDIPLYANMTVVMSHAEAENQSFLIQATSTDSVAKISKFYDTEAARHGWEEKNTTVVQQGKMKLLGYEKDGRTLQVTVANTDDGDTALSITTSSGT